MYECGCVGVWLFNCVCVVLMQTANNDYEWEEKQFPMKNYVENKQEHTRSAKFT